jgi:acetyl esterase/lipase
LAPWLPDGEPLIKLRPPVTFAHGTDDTITDPRATTAYADRLRAAGTPVTVYAVTDETHPMLHRASDWNTLVATFTASALADSAPTVEDETESLPQYGHRSSLPAAVASIALARLRLPVVERFQVVKVAKARG